MTGVDAVHGALAGALVAAFPARAARELERLEIGDAAAFLGEADPPAAAATLRAIAPAIARDITAELEPEQAAAIAAELPAPWAAALLRTAPAERLEAVLGSVAEPQRRRIRRALEHPPGSVGALADPQILALASDLDAGAALEQVRGRAGGGESIYVVDRNGLLVGVIGLAAVLAAPRERRLADLVESEPVAVRAAEDGRSVARHPAWARWRSLPVVDDEGLLVGRLGFATIQRLVLDAPRQAPSISLPVSLAELFWLGLAGITDGMARVVATGGQDRDG